MNPTLKPVRPADPHLLAQRRSVYWRVHFWAALIASPFALLAALTGILYIFTPQIEALLYARLDQVAVIGKRHSLDEAVKAANAAAPAGTALKYVQPPVDPGDSVKLTYAPEGMAGAHAGHEGMMLKRPTFGQPASATVVYVDPYTLHVLGSMKGEDRFNLWAKRLHSRLLQGDGWRWLIELAASWMMVMLISGIVLWWPKGAHSGLPQSGARGRRAWRQWHAFVGVALSLITLVILSTGLTWSKQAGGQIRGLRDWTGQASPAAPGHVMSMPETGVAQLGWQAAWDVVRAQTPAVALQLTPPAGEFGVWRAQAVDRSKPLARFDLVIDAYAGHRLYYAGWDDETAFGKATAIGIPFHRGEFGWWNQALLLLFGGGVLFSLFSGWVMVFKRHKPGSPWLPLLLPGAWRRLPVWHWIGAVLLCALMPLLAISAAIVLLLEIAMACGVWPARAQR